MQQRKMIRMSAVVLILWISVHFPFIASAQENDPLAYMELLQKARQLTSEKKWSDAARAWEQVKDQNPVQGEYWAQLAQAYYSDAAYEKAIEAYKKQLSLGFGFLPNAAYNIACCFALKGDREEALTWLEKSFAMGFRSYQIAQKDEDLKSLRSDPRFVKIVALADVSAMTRTEGWRYDMEILKKEVERKAFLRRDLSLDEFNRQYQRIYQSVDKMTDVQLIMELMKLMVLVNDGHSSLFPPSRKEFQRALPLQFYFFKEGLYIIAADPKLKHLLGSKVTGFDNKSVKEVSTALSELLSRDNDMGVLQNLPSFMRHTVELHGLGLTKDPEKVTLKMEDASGKTFTESVSADTTVVRVDHKMVPTHWTTLFQSVKNPVPLYLKNIKTLFWFEPIPNTKTLYFQWNTVRNDKSESLAQFTDRLFRFINENGMDQLIIDLRWNNVGNTMLMPYFINALIKNDKINKRGNLFVITGRRTFSAAQNLATYLEKQTEAIFVGEPTGSSPNFVGEEDFITLPYSKLAMNVSDLYWQSSWPGDHRTWIAPQLYVPPSFKAYSQNKDEALDAILRIIKEGKKSF